MPNAQYLTQIFIKVGGANVPDELMHSLAEVVVDASLYLPDMVTILIYDHDFKWVDDALLDIGKEVEISIETSEELGARTDVLFKGEITALEPHFDWEGNTTLLVRGYDKSHRLHRGKVTRTFLKQTDQDIVKKIAGEVGLSPDIDSASTGISYEYIIQNNQTNMEFLMARAERIGYQVYADGKRLYFKKGDANLGTGPDLTLGDELMHFEPRWRATHQADEITVQGWDALNKKVLTGTVTPSASLNQGGMSKTGGAMAQGAFNAAKAMVAEQPVFTVDEAKALATGLSNDISREFVVAKGTCVGDPRIKAGWTVTITNVGTRFSGKYLVTSATHVYNAQGYETTFQITGRHPSTVSRLVSAQGGGNGRTARGYMLGVTVGIVTNIKDPEELGRIKVKYPYLGQEIESAWMRMAPPLGGSDRGIYYLPEVNDEVLVAFEHGDPNRPYMLGALWNKEDKPPATNSDAIGDKVKQRVVKSTSGHTIILQDTQSEEQILVTSKSGHAVLLDDKSGSEKVSITDKTGKNSVVIDSAKNSITIALTGDYTVDAKGKATHQIVGNVMIDSKGNVNIKGATNVQIESMGNMTLKSTGSLTLQGTQVSVKGTAMVEIQGGLVKIN